MIDEIDPLPAVLSIDEAIAQQHYVLPPVRVTRGDAAAAIASSPHQLSGEFRVGGQEHGRAARCRRRRGRRGRGWRRRQTWAERT